MVDSTSFGFIMKGPMVHFTVTSYQIFLTTVNKLIFASPPCFINYCSRLPEMAAPPQPLPLPPNPPPIQLPAQPNDPNVPLPTAPVSPPTVNNVLAAIKYRQNVDLSIGMYITYDMPFNFLIGSQLSVLLWFDALPMTIITQFYMNMVLLHKQ